MTPLAHPLHSPPDGAQTHPDAADDAARGALQEDIWREIRSRIVEVNETTMARMQEDAHLGHRLGYVGTQASLFFNYHIPVWPPRLLIRKLIRKVAFPFMMPQVSYNEAVHDVLRMMVAREKTQELALQEAAVALDDMSGQIAQLRQQVARLEAQLHASPNGARDNAMQGVVLEEMRRR